MNPRTHSPIRALALAGVLAMSMAGASVALAQTPAVTGCADVATPGMTHHAGHGAMAPGTPVDMHQGDHAGIHDIDFDLMYIDMMIPHHESIVALAHVALPELTHPDLIAMAEAIIATQDAEIEELTELRDEWYPDAAPVPMDVMHGMPGMSGDMAMMEQQMSAEWQVQTFCAAEDKDLAFIEQTIPHHQMAIDTSEPALTEAEHEEIREIARDVIDAQEQEIAELEAIRAELTGEATPEGTPSN